MKQIIEEYTEEAKLFLLDMFVEKNGYAQSDLGQMKVLWHFFGRFILRKPKLLHTECERFAMLAAYLHDVLGISDSTIVRWFDKEKLLDRAFTRLKEAGKLDLFLKEAEVVHVSVAKDGSVSPTILH